MKAIVILFLSVTFSHGFLFDTSTPSTTGGGGSQITDRHYYDLLDMIMDERRYRRQMEHYIVGKLQQDLESMKNETETTKDKYQKLLVEHSQLQTKMAQLENDTGRKSDIQNIQNQVNNSRDEYKRLIGDLQKSTDHSFHNISVIQNELLMNMTSVHEQLTTDSHMVGFTACGGFRTYGRNPNMYFRDIKTAYGINNVTLGNITTSGIFTCEKPGLYLIITSIMAYNANARYNIWHNKVKHLGSVQISPFYDLQKIHDRMYHTGTGAAVVQLHINDTIQVSPFDLEKTFTSVNCLSIVKLQ